jgi:hypothetical protein
MMMDNNNNFANVVDYTINNVVKHVNVIMMFFDDFEIVPCRIDKDNLDQSLLMVLEQLVFLVLVQLMIQYFLNRFLQLVENCLLLNNAALLTLHRSLMVNVTVFLIDIDHENISVK